MTEPSSHIPPPPALTPEEVGPRCVVTGGAGYVGSALVSRLRAIGCEVVSLDVCEHEGGMVGDLRDVNQLHHAFEGCDTVFHVAALINLLSLYHKKDAELVQAVNVDGTRNVIDAAKAAGVTSVVHTSTFNVVLDRVIDHGDESERYAVDTGDLYTLSKIEAEKIALAADQPGGLRTAAIRPGGIWGCDIKSMMIYRFISQLGTGKFKATIGDGTATMDNTHVENLIDAEMLAAKGLRQNADTVGGQAYFVTDNEILNALEWFRPLSDALGYPFPTMKVPGKLMLGIARASEVIHYLGGPEPLLCYRGVRNLIESSSFKIDKAREQLGYEPRYQRANGFPPLVPLARDFIATLK